MSMSSLKKRNRAELEAEVARLRRRAGSTEAAERVAKIGYWEWNYDEVRLTSCSDGYARIFKMTIEEVLVQQSSLEKFRRADSSR